LFVFQLKSSYLQKHVHEKIENSANNNSHDRGFDNAVPNSFLFFHFWKVPISFHEEKQPLDDGKHRQNGQEKRVHFNWHAIPQPAA
jgi:hypothetical protein